MLCASHHLKIKISDLRTHHDHEFGCWGGFRQGRLRGRPDSSRSCQSPLDDLCPSFDSPPFRDLRAPSLHGRQSKPNAVKDPRPPPRSFLHTTCDTPGPDRGCTPDIGRQPWRNLLRQTSALSARCWKLMIPETGRCSPELSRSASVDPCDAHHSPAAD